MVPRVARAIQRRCGQRPVLLANVPVGLALAGGSVARRAGRCAKVCWPGGGPTGVAVGTGAGEKLQAAIAASPAITTSRAIQVPVIRPTAFMQLPILAGRRALAPSAYALRQVRSYSYQPEAKIRPSWLTAQVCFLRSVPRSGFVST